MDKSSWWYWFTKLDGNLAQCNNCDWTRNRGTAKSTSILRSHLKSKHNELFKEKMLADLSAGVGSMHGRRHNIRGRRANRQLKDDNGNIDLDTMDKNNTEVEADESFQSPYDDDNEKEGMGEWRQQVLMSMINSFGSTSSNIESCSQNQICLKKGNMGNSGSHRRHLTHCQKKEVSNDTSYFHFPAQPVVKLCRVETFSSAHSLNNSIFDDKKNIQIYGKCNNVHGHNYTWKVVLEGPVDAQTGMVYNMSDLKREMAEVIELVDHKNLDKDVPYFETNNIVTTTENVAVFLFEQLYSRMTQPDLLKKVIVEETNKNSFTYSGRKIDGELKMRLEQAL